MSGGTFVTQNKIRPGVYVNLKGQPNNIVNISDTGTLAVVTTNGWGPLGVVREVLSSEWTQRAEEFTGGQASVEDPFTVSMSVVNKMYFVRVGASSSVKATVTAGGLTVSALYGGTLGNQLAVQVVSLLSGGYQVNTFLGDNIVDTQVTTDGSNLVSNNYVSFVVGTIAPVVKTPLTGGTSVAPTASEIGAALSALEGYKFDVIATDTADLSFKALFDAYGKRNYEEAGKAFSVFLADYGTADYYRTNSVKNGGFVGTKAFTANETAIIVGAMRAGAGINQSLTYATVPYFTDANPRLTNAQTEAAILAGEIVLTYDVDRVVVELDVNTQKTLGQEINEAFKNNRVVAVLNAIVNDLPTQFRRQFIGKVDANRNGLDLVRASVISYMTGLQNINAIQNFNAQTDVEVEIGQSANSIVITLYVQPVNSIEKIYMSVEVK